MSLSRTDRLSINVVVEGILESLDVQKYRGTRRTVWLSIDFRTLIRSTRIKHSLANELALEIVGAVLEGTCGGTVLVSAFNFNFPRTKRFVVESDPVQTGSFGQLLMSRCPANRTSHPFYSFIVFGEGERELLSSDLSDPLVCRSQGQDSIFDWLTKSETDLVTLGYYYAKALPILHHAEFIASIDYRRQLIFEGVVSRQGVDRAISCGFFARELHKCDVSNLTERGDVELRRRDLLRMVAVRNLPQPLLVYCINQRSLCEVVTPDLLDQSFRYVDYFGPEKANFDVITRPRADRLYFKDLHGPYGFSNPLLTTV